MKIVLDLEINGELKQNDIIVFKDKKWKVISKESFLAQVTSNQIQLKEEIEKMNNDMALLKENINEKLKEYHNILQILTKEK